MMLFGARALAQAPSHGPAFDPTPIRIPATPESGAPRSLVTQDLLRLRDIAGLQISPDGRHIAFVLVQAVPEANGYRTGLFVVDTAAGSVPISLGTAGPPHWNAANALADEAPQWSADNASVFYRTNRSGTWQVWRWPLNGSAPVQVTHATHDVAGFELSPDRSKLVLRVAMPLSSEETARLAEGGVLYDGSVQPWVPKPYLEGLIANRAQQEVWIHELQDGTFRRPTEAESRREDVLNTVIKTDDIGSGVFGGRLSPDGQHVVYQRAITDPAQAPRNSYPIFARSVRGGPPVALTPGAYYIDQYWWSVDSRHIYYSLSDGEGRAPRIMRTDPVGGKSRLLLAPAGMVKRYSFDDKARFAACVSEDNTTPPQIGVADIARGNVRTLVDVNPEFRRLRLNPGRRVEVMSSFGVAYRGQLVLPDGYDGRRRLPLVITTYRSGAGFLRGAVGDEYPIHALAARGFAVFAFEAGVDPNYADGDFDTAVQIWASPLRGMEAAVEKLASEGIVDRERVAITGLSYGSELVDYAISHSGLFRAAISSGGGSRDPFFFYMSGRSWQNGYFKQWGLGGWPDGESAARWKRLSTQLNAHGIRAALLVNAAQNTVRRSTNGTSIGSTSG